MNQATKPYSYAGFLLDENLPKQLAHGLDAQVTFATELGQQVTDSEIWEYAQQHHLVIISKDADFVTRMLLLDSPPPWVIQVSCGNLKSRELRLFLQEHWREAIQLLPAHRLIRLHLNGIEAMR